MNITLTEKGVAEHDRVLQLVFAYLDMLREKGPQNWLYDEQARLAELSFRFREPGNPSSYVTALANGMHYYAPRDVLRGPYVMNDYDQAVLTELMGHLRPDNALVMLSDADVDTDSVSRHYAVPYSQRPLDASVITAGHRIALAGAQRVHRRRCVARQLADTRAGRANSGLRERAAEDMVHAR